MRVIPLVIDEEKLNAAKKAAGDKPLLELLPYVKKTAAIITTGGEVAKGLIEDKFTPVVEQKLAQSGISVIFKTLVSDEKSEIVRQIAKARAGGAEIIICTGGMSVDPDDRTPAAINESGATVVSYGAPVLPGAMLLIGYYDDGTPVLGLPGCVMYAQSTVFDLILPRIAAGVSIDKKDIARMGHGGLCLACQPCTYPSCAFGKGS
jgi:molybdenum cofactor synthesis domain-containing protein